MFHERPNERQLWHYKKVKFPTSVTRNSSHKTDKPEADGLISFPLSTGTPFYQYLKLFKS